MQCLIRGEKKDLFPIQKFEIIFLESLAEHFFGGWQFMICWNECICSGADFLHDFEIPVDPHAHRSGVIMIDTVVRTKNDPLFELIINEKNLFKNLFSVDKRRTWRGIDKHGSTTAGMVVSAAFCTEKFSVKCDAFVTPGPAHMSQSKTESFHMHQTFKLHGTVEIRGNLSIPEDMNRFPIYGMNDKARAMERKAKDFLSIAEPQPNFAEQS